MRYLFLAMMLLAYTLQAAARCQPFVVDSVNLQLPPAKDDDDEMNTSLADQAEDTHVMNPAEAQLEGAFLLNHFDTGSHALIGRALLRVGILKWLELRAVAEDGRHRDRYLEETTQSITPMAIGARALLATQHGILPDVGITAWVRLPFTSRTASQLPYWSPAISAAFGYELGDKWHLILNGGFKQEAFSRDKAWTGNAEIEYKLTEKTALFAEYAGQYQRAGHPQHNADAGVVVSLTDNVQAYAAGGGTLGYEEPNSFVTIGFAVRARH